MPRRARVQLPGVPLHIVQRANNRAQCFFNTADFQRFLDDLSELSAGFECPVHAYVLMSNHVHLLVTPLQDNSAARLMKHVGKRYTQHVNRTHGRTGTLWEGRYRSCLVDSEAYALACYRYLELNPVRAAMVAHPGEYRWSSYAANAHGSGDSAVTPHPLYLALGDEAASRQNAYRELFGSYLDEGELQRIRHATRGNFVLGTPAFGETISRQLRRRVAPGVPGRPKTA